MSVEHVPYLWCPRRSAPVLAHQRDLHKLLGTAQKPWHASADIGSMSTGIANPRTPQRAPHSTVLHSLTYKNTRRMMDGWDTSISRTDRLCVCRIKTRRRCTNAGDAVPTVPVPPHPVASEVGEATGDDEASSACSAASSDGGWRRWAERGRRSDGWGGEASREQPAPSWGGGLWRFPAMAHPWLVHC